jgi:hypothetical protein
VIFMQRENFVGEREQELVLCCWWCSDKDLSTKRQMEGHRFSWGWGHFGEEINISGHMRVA